MIIGQSNITEAERQLRLEAIAQSAATNLLEGLQSSPEANEIFRQFADGEISLDEMGAAIEALSEQKFGPLPISRD